MKEFKDELVPGSILMVRAPLVSAFHYIDLNLEIRTMYTYEGRPLFVPGFLVPAVDPLMEVFLKDALIKNFPDADELHTAKYSSTDDYFFMYSVKFNV